jgi:predicted RecB family endonuclease
LAGVFTALGAAAEEEAGAGAAAGAAVFLAAGIFVFDLMAELEDDISNAVVILLVVLTCLNHNLVNALTIMKHIG